MEFNLRLRLINYRGQRSACHVRLNLSGRQLRNGLHIPIAWRRSWRHLAVATLLNDAIDAAAVDDDGATQFVSDCMERRNPLIHGEIAGEER